MSFLSGAGGTNSTSNSFSYFTPKFYTPYQDQSDRALTAAQELGGAPFQPYDVSKMFAPFSADQTTAFGNVANLAASSYQPYFASGLSSLDQYTGVNPITSAAPYFNLAQNTPSGQTAASPYFATAAQTWPGASSSYLNPYINNTVSAANQLQTQNFLQNVMPGLNSQFVASGGGLGSPQYDRAGNWALTNFNQNLGNTDQSVLAKRLQRLREHIRE
jgi:hypothetical protein